MKNIPILPPNTKVRVIKSNLVGMVVDGIPTEKGKVEIAFHSPWVGWYGVDELEIIQSKQDEGRYL